MNHRRIFLATVTLATAGLAVGASQLAFSQQASGAVAEAPDLNGFWTHGFSLGFDPPPDGGPGPVHDVKTKAQMRAMGQFLVHDADASNPILQPWAAAEVKKATEAEKRGTRIPTKQEICFPSGVPNYWTHPLLMQLVQTKDYVVFLHARDHQIRIVHLNKPHVANPQPSWYGDSVGHFEGDTLVVDTVGFLPGFLNTPVRNSANLHVVERFSLDPKTVALTRNYAAEDPVYLKGKYTGSDTMFVADAPYNPGRCQDLSFIDYSKQQKQ